MYMLVFKVSVFCMFINCTCSELDSMHAKVESEETSFKTTCSAHSESTTQLVDKVKLHSTNSRGSFAECGCIGKAADDERKLINKNLVVYFCHLPFNCLRRNYV